MHKHYAFVRFLDFGKHYQDPQEMKVGVGHFLLLFYIPIKDLDEQVEQDPSLLDGFLEDKEEEAEPEMKTNRSSSVETVTIRRPDGVRLNKEECLMFLCLHRVLKRERQ